MPNRRIEDIAGGELTTTASGDLLVILDKSDTTDDPDGTTKYVKVQTLYDGAGHFNAASGAAFTTSLLTVDGTNDVDVDLNNGNHWEVDLAAATGSPVDMDIVVPSNSGLSAGTFYLKQDDTARDISWNPDTGTVHWPETEPSWSGGDFPSGEYMIVNWLYYANANRLVLVSLTSHS